ncbi:MAG: cytochrome-c oxidase, cbb3-type subunit III [Rhodospirillaceae bacterium]|jgi:cytochrome c oxidase cbb3-type subunit III|nr:cytochrome-c oxidase, cbb3-type subunit III [Rhodospirillaceae bacterium]MBT5894696.1 cytochrome-c oxidase, cbb3-type subunit III [Rhodospirillaceae bacterium]MBT6429442.1 cytochrome-c oxidase, cbb3-type subunit III [Rhodospirillaceae bacterium]MBT7755910.1 cytochrome-c oxidase, cbb3-type subunit III [Rhodospirillaceae bacterium]
MTDKPIDDVSGVVTTGHEWDGIRELDTPMPRWWLWTYYACVIWAIGYWIAMPAWPLVSDYTRGVLGHSQRAQLSGEIAAVKAGQADLTARTAKASLAEIKADAELLEFALAGGRSAYAVNCSQCHGSGAAGSDGYPNLNDDDWIWGGTVEQIHATIQYGIRADHDDTRDNEMPAFGRDEMLDPQQVDAVSDYVMALSRDDGVADTLPGKALYTEHCVDCHGPGGAGNMELGAPKLRDGIWLYQGDKAMVVDMITNSRAGMMPAWVDRLDKVTLKQLAVYIHSLGGGA